MNLITGWIPRLHIIAIALGNIYPPEPDPDLVKRTGEVLFLPQNQSFNIEHRGIFLLKGTSKNQPGRWVRSSAC
ncbi:hypothetical protein SAMN04244547_05005 [Azotobacter vinelandii]|nr:hypothetical protein SAMN04244547_05005 [Azotobacter vinelandii]